MYQSGVIACTCFALWYFVLVAAFNIVHQLSKHGIFDYLSAGCGT